MSDSPRTHRWSRVPIDSAISDSHWLRAQDARVAEAEELLTDALHLLGATATCQIPSERRLCDLMDRIVAFLGEPEQSSDQPSVAETCLTDRDFNPGAYS